MLHIYIYIYWIPINYYWIFSYDKLSSSAVSNESSQVTRIGFEWMNYKTIGIGFVVFIIWYLFRFQDAEGQTESKLESTNAPTLFFFIRNCPNFYRNLTEHILNSFTVRECLVTVHTPARPYSNGLWCNVRPREKMHTSAQSWLVNFSINS